MAKVKDDNYILGNDSPFLVQEAYKNLRTNLRYSFPNDGSHVIGITSPDREEGKSTSAINLAISFSQIEKRVIILDCDLRIPTVAKKLKLNDAPGLSDYLIGDISFKECVQFDKEHGLYVISAGHIPPDSTLLIQSDKMHHLVEELRKTFDYIILDFPPVGIVSDAQTMAEFVDGYLLIVRSDTTVKKDLDKAIDALKFVNANIIGFVMTHNTNSSSSYRGKKYKYNYNYYGYSQKGDRRNK